MAVTSKMKIKNASITRDNLLELLKSIIKDGTLIAPVKGELDDVNFLPVSDVAEICFDYENTTTSPKEFFFPQYECMFCFSGPSSDNIKIKGDTEEIVLFGIRSCDVKGIELLDKFYERTFEDDYYTSKRKNSVLISVGCCELNEQCFCTSTGTGPVLKEGFDIQLLNSGTRCGGAQRSRDGYVAQIGSEKGLALYKKYQKLFGPAAKADADELLKEVKKQPLKFDLQKVKENLEQEKMDADFWEDMGERCQSCGLCLFLCPTCSCYSVTDRDTPLGESRRSRQWDACYFRGFTRMAGGMDPVRDRTQMIKRKYQHKLVQQIDEFAMSGCVGCGRCSLACVGNVNWLENIIKIERGN